MYVVVCSRIVKVNTGATEKFAPRTANQTRLTVSGPFLSVRAAQRAVLTALGTHTCLDAQVWSEAQVREKIEKSYNLRHEEQELFAKAVHLFDAVAVAK